MLRLRPSVVIGRVRILAAGAAAVGLLLATAGCTVHRPPEGPRVLGGAPWSSPVAREHPLAGRIYDVAARRMVTFDELSAALSRAGIVLLGEQHDNVDHHRIQARLLSGMIDTGGRPTIAFEQIDIGDQAAVDRAIAPAAATPSERASSLAAAVKWEGRGWPPFDEYRPVFEVALAAGLPIRAANLPREALRGPSLPASTAKAASPGGARSTEIDAAPAASGIDLDAWRGVELADAARHALEADIEDSHCGMANAAMTAAMMEAQRRRDDAMAQVVDLAAESGGTGKGGASAGTAASPRRAGPRAVLVCGFGHARRDYGVPVHLRPSVSALPVVSVALLEVIPELMDPAAYAGPLHAEALPFDYVVFTPKVDDADPCEKFRSSLHSLKTR